jgi:hypothetical protein
MFAQDRITDATAQGAKTETVQDTVWTRKTHHLPEVKNHKARTETHKGSWQRSSKDVRRSEGFHTTTSGVRQDRPQVRLTPKPWDIHGVASEHILLERD